MLFSGLMKPPLLFFSSAPLMRPLMHQNSEALVHLHSNYPRAVTDELIKILSALFKIRVWYFASRSIELPGRPSVKDDSHL